MIDAVKATQGKVTGVIIPPPEIRAVVDRTAQFVAKNGKSFEQRILSSAEGQTPKFNFMRPFDPYHAYYEAKIRETEDAIANGGIDEAKSEKPAESQPKIQEETRPEPDAKSTAAPAAVATAVKASIVNPIAQLAQTKPTEAPPELEFCVAQGQPAGLTPLDIDIIKLAAQFTAINGREFLANLALREQRNPQYDFLKPTHMLFSYFTYLVDCYAKIVNPSAALLRQVEERCDFGAAMERAVRRWQWSRAEEERKRQESGEGDSDRLAFQAIDWYDFTVVETIDFPEDELLELPGFSGIDLGASGAPAPPLAPTPAGAARPGPPPPPPPRAPTAPTAPATAATSSNGKAVPSYYAPSADLGAMDTEDQDHHQQQDQDQDMQDTEDLSDLKVVADYQHGGAGGTGGAGLLMVDPISGKAVPVDQLSEHMRVQLLDPRWRQQQQRFIDKHKETGYAEGSSIADSLKHFARKRGDIFGQAATGSGADSAAAIAEQEALERRKAEIQSQVQWDGHYGSIAGVQALKHELASKAPAAFQLPPTAVKAAPSIGPAVPAPVPVGAPVVAHYALPTPSPATVPVPVSAPMMAGALPPPPPPLLPGQVAVGFVPPLPQAAAPHPLAAVVGGLVAGPPPLPYGAPAPVPVPVPVPVPPVLPSGYGYGYAAGGADAEPASKRAKTESTAGAGAGDSAGLMPADAFLALHGGPAAQASVLVQVPVSEDSGNPAGWNLNGQTLTLGVTLASTAKQIKEQLSSQHLGGLPANKLQLKFAPVGFLKDAQSLAEANVPPGALLELSLKSRGGKR